MYYRPPMYCFHCVCTAFVEDFLPVPFQNVVYPLTPYHQYAIGAHLYCSAHSSVAGWGTTVILVISCELVSHTHRITGSVEDVIGSHPGSIFPIKLHETPLMDL